MLNYELSKLEKETQYFILNVIRERECVRKKLTFLVPYAIRSTSHKFFYLILITNL